MQIADPLRDTAIQRPNAPALDAPGRTLSYRTLDRVVTATAAHLRAIGVDPGMRVAVYLPRSWQAVVVLMAIMRAEAIASPISTRLPPARVMAHLQEIQSVLLITDDHDVTAAAEDELAVLTASAVLLTGRSERRTETWPVQADQPSTIIFTSGSSGTAKAALHTMGNHYFSAAGSNQNIPLRPGDRWLLSLPVYHVGGLAILFRCWLAGATAVIADPSADLPRALTEHRITHASIVPTQLRRLLHDAPADPSATLSALLIGGGPVPRALVEAAHERGYPLHTTYGMTETSSQVTTTPPKAPLNRLTTSGRCLPHRDVKISPEQEILVRGNVLFQGYVAGSTVRDPRDEEGWLHTGDLGRIDDEGYLHVQGRKDSQFISGGENIQPEEIERTLIQQEGVRRAVVVPVPDAEFGQRPVAFVQMDMPLSPAQLTRQLEATLPRFMIPVEFYTWPEDVGTTRRMKADRPAFREEARRRQASDRSQ
jgi:O-succinylbenzoic acid--CoA ligase